MCSKTIKENIEDLRFELNNEIEKTARDLKISIKVYDLSRKLDLLILEYMKPQKSKKKSQ